MRRQNGKILQLVQFSILLAIEAILCFTPLGSLPALGPIVATLAMIPVTLTAIIMGTKWGSLMGFFTGLFSFVVWTFMPPNPLTAFIFTPFVPAGQFTGNFGSILICFIPRILTGTVTGISYHFLKRKTQSKKLIRYGLSAFLGSMTNTLLVVAGIGIFFGAVYQEMMGQLFIALVGSTILFSGIPEAVLAALVATGACPILTRKQRI